MTTASEFLIELSDTLNDALGMPYCPAPCEHGGRCSLGNGHEYDHQALGSDGRILCTWRNDDYDYSV